MEEVVAAATPPPPKEKEELDQVVDDKREEGVPESDVAKEVGVKQERVSYNETRQGSGLFLWRDEQSTNAKKEGRRSAPQMFGAIMVDCVQHFFGLGDTISVQTVFFFFFFFFLIFLFPQGGAEEEQCVFLAFVRSGGHAYELLVHSRTRETTSRVKVGAFRSLVESVGPDVPAAKAWLEEYVNSTKKEGEKCLCLTLFDRQSGRNLLSTTTCPQTRIWTETTGLDLLETGCQQRLSPT
jgi:hypothetical protein